MKIAGNFVAIFNQFFFFPCQSGRFVNFINVNLRKVSIFRREKLSSPAASKTYCLIPFSIFSLAKSSTKRARARKEARSRFVNFKSGRYCQPSSSKKSSYSILSQIIWSLSSTKTCNASHKAVRRAVLLGCFVVINSYIRFFKIAANKIYCAILLKPFNTLELLERNAIQR